jgi:hypothetical protein
VQHDNKKALTLFAWEQKQGKAFTSTIDSCTTLVAVFEKHVGMLTNADRARACTLFTREDRLSVRNAISCGRLLGAKVLLPKFEALFSPPAVKEALEVDHPFPKRRQSGVAPAEGAEDKAQEGDEGGDERGSMMQTACAAMMERKRRRGKKGKHLTAEVWLHH